MGFETTIAGFDDLPMPGAIIELDGTIVAVNRATSALLARSTAQVVDRKVWEFAPGIEHAWRDIVGASGSQAHHGEMTCATPLGPRAIHYIAVQRTFDTRTVLLAFGIDLAAIDATRDLDEPARRNESLGLVAGGIAHDFNNQLVAVLAEASSAREDRTISPGVSEALRRIEAAAQRMAMLTRQLLAYAGRGRFVLEVFEPDELVRDLRSDLESVLDKNVALASTFGAPGYTVNVDRTQLREVIRNLVQNACEALAGRAGTIRISTSIATHRGTSCWRLEVSDPGVGMDEATRRRIFDPFFTTKRERHGLGLSVAYGIVRRFGGEIRVSSEPNKGALFTVLLPTTDRAALPRRSRTVSESAVSLRRVNVLVADDEPSVRTTLRRLLERRGAVVALAADGDEAEAALENARYDLVLFDVMMPKQTGYQLMPKIRRKQPSAKVILMSGYTDGDGSPNGTDNDPDGFLEKPFTTKQFDDMVDSVLGTE